MSPINRRSLLTIASTAGALGSATGSASAQAHGASSGQSPEMAAHMREMMTLPPGAPKVAMLVYPNMVALDLIGPMTVFTILRCDVQLVWKDRRPVATDVGVPIAATRTFGEVDKNLDVLFVPGGIMGTVDCMDDAAVRGFLADIGSRAKWVTGVCTGTLILAAAGLLKGYDATSHWAVADLLPLMGARHVDQRVVRDRNRLTGGGVTAGIDFALTLAELLADEETARRIALIIEYAPAPPFKNGTPAEAGPARTADARSRRALHDAEALSAAQAAGRRLGIKT